MADYCKSDNKNLSMAIRKNLKVYFLFRPLLAHILSHHSLTLPQEAEPKFADECKRLETVLGFPVTFEFQATPNDLKTAYKGYDERAGEFALAHLKGAVDVYVSLFSHSFTLPPLFSMLAYSLHH